MNKPDQPATGYSGTPLAKKLGIKPGTAVHAINAPPHYCDLLAPLPSEVTFRSDVASGASFVHLFALVRADLAPALEHIRPLLATDGMIWVSWPKKASNVPTDITEDTIRAVALPMGLVDVKVCAVDATWSGLKLVIRKALR